MATLLPPRRQRVTYSGVITAGPVARAAQHARQMRAIGLRDIKVKVGFDDDVARVTAVREALGPAASLRLDANGAWGFERAVEVLNAVAPLCDRGRRAAAAARAGRGPGRASVATLRSPSWSMNRS